MIPQFLEVLESYFSQIWTATTVPEKWRLSRITPIWKKKGNASDPTKYRGISIGSTLSKIGINIILNRLSEFYESQLSRTQFGFRSGLGCNDGIYALKQLHEIASSSDRKLYVCFIDLSAAFDHVNRDLLFRTIHCRLPPGLQSNNLEIMKILQGHIYKVKILTKIPSVHHLVFGRVVKKDHPSTTCTQILH